MEEHSPSRLEEELELKKIEESNKKKARHGATWVVLGGIVALVGLGMTGLSKTDLTLKLGDHVKIKNLVYEVDSAFTNSGQLSFDVKRRDKDGIKEIRYLLDKKLVKTKIYGLDPVEGEISQLDSVVIDRNIGKGKHKLRAILEDYQGKKVGHTYSFEIK